MAKGSIIIFTGRLHLCHCAVTTIAVATIVIAATSTTDSSVILAAITISMAVYTNPTKLIPTAATVAIFVTA
eukprot:15347055-Ditylum_brightwellii.AAC.1